MAYCSSSDVEKRLPTKTLIQLTDDEGLADAQGTLADAITANPLIDTRIDDAIEAADVDIDSYLRARYATPIAIDGATPTPIKQQSVGLTIYYLHERRQSEFGLPDAVMDSRKATLRMLDAINRGTIDIGVEPPPASSAKAVAEASGEDRLFTVDTLGDF